MIAIRGTSSQHRLAGNLAMGECPVPASHDRVVECHYFLQQMLKEYHQPEAFRFNLHAFLQATKSFFALLLLETQGIDGFCDFRLEVKTAIRTPEIAKLRKLRDQLVHQEPLLASSSVSVGMFRGYKLKMAFNRDCPPSMPSFDLLINVRNSPLFVHPQRPFQGEQGGVYRIWKLPNIGDVDIACVHAWEICAKLVRSAHTAAHVIQDEEGFDFEVEKSRHLLEHQIFPEIAEAWEQEPPALMTSTTKTAVYERPDVSSRVLQDLTAGQAILCWLSEMRWGRNFTSLLIAEIDGIRIKENTAGFIDVKHFRRSEVAPSHERPN
jgi:hypothetical protein